MIVWFEYTRNKVFLDDPLEKGGSSGEKGVASSVHCVVSQQSLSVFVYVVILRTTLIDGETWLTDYMG